MSGKRVAVAALFIIAFLAGCSHSAAPAPVPPAVTMSFCGSAPQPTPTVVDVVCNTGDITARNLAWSGWGKPTATATGTAVVDLCAYEDCHTGAFGNVPIKLIASRIAGCAGHGRAYTQLHYVFVDGSPWAGVPADMKTSGYISAPDRTLPPENQTVGLACS